MKKLIIALGFAVITAAAGSTGASAFSSVNVGHETVSNAVTPVTFWGHSHHYDHNYGHHYGYSKHYWKHRYYYKYKPYYYGNHYGKKYYWNKYHGYGHDRSWCCKNYND